MKEPEAAPVNPLGFWVCPQDASHRGTICTACVVRDRYPVHCEVPGCAYYRKCRAGPPPKITFNIFGHSPRQRVIGLLLFLLSVAPAWAQTPPTCPAGSTLTSLTITNVADDSSVGVVAPYPATSWAAVAALPCGSGPTVMRAWRATRGFNVAAATREFCPAATCGGSNFWDVFTALLRFHADAIPANHVVTAGTLHMRARQAGTGLQSNAYNYTIRYYDSTAPFSCADYAYAPTGIEATVPMPGSACALTPTWFDFPLINTSAITLGGPITFRAWLTDTFVPTNEEDISFETFENGDPPILDLCHAAPPPTPTQTPTPTHSGPPVRHVGIEGPTIPLGMDFGLWLTVDDLTGIAAFYFSFEFPASLAYGFNIGFNGDFLPGCADAVSFFPSGTVQIAGTCTPPLTAGSGDFVAVLMHSIATGSGPLHFTGCVLDEGQVTCTTHDSTLEVVGPTITPTHTPTETPTDTPTDTPTQTLTPTGGTLTPTQTLTVTSTPTVTDTPTITATPTITMAPLTPFATATGTTVPTPGHCCICLGGMPSYCQTPNYACRDNFVGNTIQCQQYCVSIGCTTHQLGGGIKNTCGGGCGTLGGVTPTVLPTLTPRPPTVAPTPSGPTPTPRPVAGCCRCPVDNCAVPVDAGAGPFCPEGCTLEGGSSCAVVP